MLQLVLGTRTESVSIQTLLECFLMLTVCLFVYSISGTTTCSGHSYRVCIHSDLDWCLWMRTVCLFGCLFVLLVQISIPQLVLVFVPTGSVSIQTLLECFLVWTACLFVQFSMLQLVLGANTGSVFTQTLLGAFWCGLFVQLFSTLQPVLGTRTESVSIQTLLSVFWCRLFAYLFAQFPALQLVLGASGGTPRGRVARGAPLPASRRPPLARRI